MRLLIAERGSPAGAGWACGAHQRPSEAQNVPASGSQWGEQPGERRSADRRPSAEASAPPPTRWESRWVSSGAEKNHPPSPTPAPLSAPRAARPPPRRRGRSPGPPRRPRLLWAAPSPRGEHPLGRGSLLPGWRRGRGRGEPLGTAVAPDRLPAGPPGPATSRGTRRHHALRSALVAGWFPLI